MGVDDEEYNIMISIDSLTTFFGWCSVINFCVIVIAGLFIVIFHEGIGAISAKMFGITKEEAKATLFHVFQQYRFAFLVLNIVPYIALKVM